MRQVFTSPRIENVEGVAKMLEDAGIEVRITHGRSYRGAIRGNFSYRADERERQGPQPAVWIVRSEDQPRARTMLREAGLLESTRTPSDSFLAATVHGGKAGTVGDPRRKRAFRLKIALLVVIAVAVALGFLALRKTPPAMPAATVPGTPASASVADPTYVIATPPALAETLLRIELEVQAPSLACIAIDGKDPSPELLARLRSQARELQPASACERTRADLRFDVNQYRTDGSGIGIVQLDMFHRTPDGNEPETRTLEVERTGDTWRILRML
jgi:hypothetical protein